MGLLCWVFIFIGQTFELAKGELKNYRESLVVVSAVEFEKRQIMIIIVWAGVSQSIVTATSHYLQTVISL